MLLLLLKNILNILINLFPGNTFINNINENTYKALFIVALTFLITSIIIIILLRKNPLLKKGQKTKFTQSKNNLAAYISNEIRSPLTLILAPITQILTSDLGENELQKNHQLIYHNSYRLLTLVDDLLDSKEIGTSQNLLNVIDTDIILFTKRLSDYFNPIARCKNINFQVYSLFDELLIYFDPNKLEKIMNNLLSNAFKYTEEDGKVDIFIAKTEKHFNPNINTSTKNKNRKTEYITISIKDSGIGIPKDQLKTIFDSSPDIANTNISEKGTGIGMRLVKRLIDEHYGTIDIESVVEKGTTITILLPQSAVSYTEDEKSNETFEIDSYHFERSRFVSKQINLSLQNQTNKPASASKYTILIVEDDTDLREYLQDILSANYNIIVASVGAQGINMAIEKKPDLIISDAIMAEVSGIELTARIKKYTETKHIPVILFADKPIISTESPHLAPNAYIPKPFQMEILEETIISLLPENTNETIHDPINKDSIKSLDVTKNDKDFLLNIQKIVEDNLTNPTFGVNELSDQAFISRSQLFRKIKTLTGLNPMEFIFQQRLEKAAYLLKTEKLSVSNAAFNVGYSSPEVFSKRFKKYFGISPSKYI